MKKRYIIILTFLLILTILYFRKDKITNIDYNLNEDGVSVIKNVLSDMEVDELKNDILNNNNLDVKNKLINNPKILNKLRSLTNNEYILQDYIWILKKSSVHTCHRDNNGDLFNKNQKYPSYTFLIYLEDMDKCLGVIPKSHKSLDNNKFNLFDQVDNIVCNKGDIILFNANLIHVGVISDNDHLRIQMKLTHPDDIETLSYYQNFNKIANKENKVPHFIKKIQKNFTCSIPVISDLSQQVNIQSARGSDNGVKIPFLQKAFSYLFYGNTKFYDLPNAF